jgi:hypothetical protein
MRRKRWLIVPVAVLAVIAFATLGGYIVRWLWNALLPPLFGLPTVTFWQALGLLALSRILFGGLGMQGGSGSHYRRRWEAMTPEERERVRERMRQRLRERWGSGPHHAPGQVGGGV